MSAWILWRLGRPAEADRVAGRLLATRWAYWYGGLARAWAAIERGQPAEAQRFVDGWWRELGDDDHRRLATERPWDLPTEAQREAIALLTELLIRVSFSDDPADDTIERLRRHDDYCKNSTLDLRLQVILLLARAHIQREQFDDAVATMARAEELSGDMSLPLHQATMLELRGLMSRAHNPSGAQRFFEDAASMLEACGNVSDRARCLRLAGEAALAMNAGPAAGEWLRTARQLATSVGADAEANRTESLMRSIGLRPRAGRPKGSGRKRGTLSPREQEVAALVAAGASNGEISRRLFISERTVQDHIAGAVKQLALGGRAGLAAWAAKQGLI